jgi:MFS family permease
VSTAAYSIITIEFP